MNLKLPDPSPNFQALTEVLHDGREPEKVPLVELAVDREVIAYLLQQLDGTELCCAEADLIRIEATSLVPPAEQLVPLTVEIERDYVARLIEFYYRMGYDYFPHQLPFQYLVSLTRPKVRLTRDSAFLPRAGGYVSGTAAAGLREWTEEHQGIITSWNDLDQVPWSSMDLDLAPALSFLQETLPPGMKVMVVGEMFEVVQDQLLGYEGLAYMLHDDRALLEEVTHRWAQVMDRLYRQVLAHDVVGGIFHADDFGHKTATVLAPQTVREIFLPWLKHYAELAHAHGKLFWFHSCGNVLALMENFIDEVGIDAFHSFQDVIIPVGRFKERYGDRIAVLGGIDVDKLARLDEASLRKYVRQTLADCMPGGRYALGSGNSVTNYVPIRNYLVMLEEARRWKNPRSSGPGAHHRSPQE